MVNTHRINIIRQLEQPQTGKPVAQRRSPEAVDREPRAKKDELVLSDRAQTVLKLQEAAARLPDIRTEKVKALREAIAQGRYEVSAKDVAEKMLARQGQEP